MTPIEAAKVIIILFMALNCINMVLLYRAKIECRKWKNLYHSEFLP